MCKGRKLRRNKKKDKIIDVFLNVELLEQVTCFSNLKLHVTLNGGEVYFRIIEARKISGGVSNV